MRDFSTLPNYLDRQMFLDGRVTIQRFEEVRYPKIQKFEQIAKGQFWQPEEINVSKDKADFKDVSRAVQHMYSSNLLRQTGLDSEQGVGIQKAFEPVCSVPEVQALVSNWNFYETNIHSFSYSHLIRGVFNMPRDEFNKIHHNPEIVAMLSSVDKYYEDLATLNEITALREKGFRDMLPAVEEEYYVDAVWLALHASYALEALRFMVSFATSLGMAENKLFMGNGAIIQLILQDELLHTDWTAYIINQVAKDDPRFAAAKIRNAAKVLAIYRDVIREEKTWAGYLCKYGPIIGLNEQILSDFVDFRATVALKAIGMKYENPMKVNPIPWFNKYIENKKQTALQEQESTNYIIGAMSAEIDYDALPEI